jgi:hypothetical protein
VLTLVVTVLMPLAPAVLAEEATPVASPAASDELFVDPAGLYTVPIPATWQATAHDGYVQITDPDGLINVYVAAIPEPVLESGITMLWDRLYTEPQPVPMDQVELPENPDYDRLLSILYDDGAASGRMMWVDAATSWRSMTSIWRESCPAS